MKSPIHRWKQFITYADGRPPHWTFDGKPCWLGSGVIDLNGVEIYEGDRVSVQGHKQPYTVTFADGKFWLGDMQYYLTYFRNSKLEIVGHITEEQS